MGNNLRTKKIEIMEEKRKLLLKFEQECMDEVLKEANKQKEFTPEHLVSLGLRAEKHMKSIYILKSL